MILKFWGLMKEDVNIETKSRIQMNEANKQFHLGSAMLHATWNVECGKCVDM
jgi:hypothetical protein